MQLYKASRQWASRPDDERFPSIQALYDATKHYADVARTAHASVMDLRVQAQGDDVALTGKSGVPALFTNWAFAQLCARVGTDESRPPAGYLRSLPPTLAAQNLNYALAQSKDDRSLQLMFHQNGGLMLRSLTSEKYTRIWDYEVAERLLTLETMGWRPARPTFNKSADDSPSLYASDHDMFAFVMSDLATIKEPGAHEPLYRGVMVQNSEVGSSALIFTSFLFRALCGNRMIWDASKVFEVNLRHVGKVNERFGLYAAELKKYAESSASDEEAKIEKAQKTLIAEDKDKLLDKLFGIKTIGLSRKTLEAGYQAVLPAEDGNPLSVWGYVQGLTRASQSIPYADERVRVDRAAGKILSREIDF
jgi:hypothetical protein